MISQTNKQTNKQKKEKRKEKKRTKKKKEKRKGKRTEKRKEKRKEFILCVANKMGLAAIYQAMSNVATVCLKRKKKYMVLVQVLNPKIFSLANAFIPPNELNLPSYGTRILRHQSVHVPEHSEVQDTAGSMGVTELRQLVA